MSAAITRDLPVQIEKLLKRELKTLAPVVAAEIAKANKSSGADDKAMAKALPGALATAMSSTVVPKFEAATSEMFDQVRGVFERGMDDLAQELYTQKENAVAAEVGPPSASLRAAAGEVRVAAEILAAGDVAAGAGAGAGAGGAGAGAPSSLAELESQMDPTVELGAMVDAGDLEGAFTKALGMSSVETVAWVCGRAEPRREEIFGASPAGLSRGPPLPRAAALVRPRRGTHAQARMDPRRVPGGGSQRPATLCAHATHPGERVQRTARERHRAGDARAGQVRSAPVHSRRQQSAHRVQVTRRERIDEDDAVQTNGIGVGTWSGCGISEGRDARVSSKGYLIAKTRSRSRASSSARAPARLCEPAGANPSVPSRSPVPS